MGATSDIDADRHRPGSPVGSWAGAADELYAAALTSLLTHAIQRPGRLVRLRTAIWSSLKALHARRRHDGDKLPPEYWFWSG
jgi:hypothetical protein